MKILFFSPWPPQHTGIADYMYDLAKGLAKSGHTITIFTEVEKPKKLNGVIIQKPCMLDDFDSRHYDLLVYQMGNNSKFHLFMLPYLFEFEGIIHLHDLVLHHLMAYCLYAHGDQQLYVKVLNKWYGQYVVNKVLDMMEEGINVWDSSAVTEFPFFEEIIQHAKGVIIHSEFSQQKIHSVFPNLGCRVIPQVYAGMQINTRQRGSKLSIGIFGGVDSNKRLDIVFQALARCGNLHEKVELNIVGSISDDCLYLKDLIHELRLDEVVTFHGRVDEAVFTDFFNATDLILALRYPTMGETSAIVMRSCQSAIPVVVSDVAWYAELPDFVPKIMPETSTEVDELASLIRNFIEVTGFSEKRVDEARAYAAKNLDFDDLINEYTLILKGMQS